MSENSILITNKQIIEFYKQNPSMDIETNCLLFIDLIQTLLQQGATINKSLSSQILNEISGLNTKMHSMQTNVSSLSTSLSSDLILKFLEIKKEYIEDMKGIISSNTIHTTEKINTLIEKNNSHLIDKTSLILNDIIPRSHETQYHQIQDKLTNFYQLINADTKQILSQTGNPAAIFQDFVSNFDSKYTSMIHNIQNISEDRITKSINSLKETTMLLHDIIPKSQELQYNQLLDKITNLYQLINVDTKQLLSQNNGNMVFQEFLGNFETKYYSMVQTIQNSSEDRLTSNINSLKETSSTALSSQEKTINELSEFIGNFESKYSTMIHTIQNSSEERLTTNINSLRDSSTASLSSQEKTMNDLSEFLSKYKNSTLKGQIGENRLFSVLNTMYPSAEIIDTSSIKASGDFLLKRENRDNILFETKFYSQNIPSDEIRKFIRDCDTQATHGIFLSHNSGIALKSNYQIDIHKNSILIYVHNAEYQPYKIQIAIDIIDSLSIKLAEFNDEDDEENTISKETIDDINTEYQSFIEQKETMHTILRDFNKRMGNQIECFSLPSVEKYLGTKFASTIKKGFNCNICNKFSAPSNKSLSAHMRACKLHNPVEIPVIPVITTIDISKKTIKKQTVPVNVVVATLP